MFSAVAESSAAEFESAQPACDAVDAIRETIGDSIGVSIPIGIGAAVTSGTVRCTLGGQPFLLRGQPLFLLLGCEFTCVQGRFDLLFFLLG